MSRIWALLSGLGSITSLLATSGPIAGYRRGSMTERTHGGRRSEERRLAPAGWRSRLGLGITSPLLDGGANQPTDAVRRRRVACASAHQMLQTLPLLRRRVRAAAVQLLVARHKV